MRILQIPVIPDSPRSLRVSLCCNASGTVLAVEDVDGPQSCALLSTVVSGSATEADFASFPCPLLRRTAVT